MKKDHNLSNPKSEPENAEMTCTVTVHFDWIGAVPKAKLQRWLESLPEEARVTFEGVRSGKAHFQAQWLETRSTNRVNERNQG